MREMFSSPVPPSSLRLLFFLAPGAQACAAGPAVCKLRLEGWNSMGSVEGSGSVVRCLSLPSALFPNALSYPYLFFLNEYVGRTASGSVPSRLPGGRAQVVWSPTLSCLGDTHTWMAFTPLPEILFILVPFLENIIFCHSINID